MIFLGPLPTSTNDIQKEMEKLSIESSILVEKLTETLPWFEYNELRADKKRIGARINILNQALRAARAERKEAVAEAFMATTIKLFSPEDLEEIWETLRVDYPHLKKNLL